MPLFVYNTLLIHQSYAVCTEWCLPASVVTNCRGVARMSQTMMNNEFSKKYI